MFRQLWRHVWVLFGGEGAGGVGGMLPGIGRAIMGDAFEIAGRFWQIKHKHTVP